MEGEGGNYRLCVRVMQTTTLLVELGLRLLDGSSDSGGREVVEDEEVGSSSGEVLRTPEIVSSTSIEEGEDERTVRAPLVATLAKAFLSALGLKTFSLGGMGARPAHCCAEPKTNWMLCLRNDVEGEAERRLS